VAYYGDTTDGQEEKTILCVTNLTDTKVIAAFDDQTVRVLDINEEAGSKSEIETGMQFEMSSILRERLSFQLRDAIVAL